MCQGVVHTQAVGERKGESEKGRDSTREREIVEGGQSTVRTGLANERSSER